MRRTVEELYRRPRAALRDLGRRAGKARLPCPLSGSEGEARRLAREAEPFRGASHRPRPAGGRAARRAPRAHGESLRRLLEHAAHRRGALQRQGQRQRQCLRRRRHPGPHGPEADEAAAAGRSRDQASGPAGARVSGLPFRRDPARAVQAGTGADAPRREAAPGADRSASGGERVERQPQGEEPGGRKLEPRLDQMPRSRARSKPTKKRSRVGWTPTSRRSSRPGKKGRQSPTSVPTFGL